MTTLRLLADERVGELYHVRLYTAADAALVAVAEPLVEERQAVEAAALLWDRYVALRAAHLEWVEVLDARRSDEAREPLVVQCELSRNADGQVQACGWRRVAWADIERRCDGHIVLEPRRHPLPTQRPTPVTPVARAPRPIPAGRAALRWPWPSVPDTLHVFSPHRASDVPV